MFCPCWSVFVPGGSGLGEDTVRQRGSEKKGGMGKGRGVLRVLRAGRGLREVR